MKRKGIRVGISRKIFQNKLLRFKILSSKGLARNFCENSECKETGRGQRTTRLTPGLTEV